MISEVDHHYVFELSVSNDPMIRVFGDLEMRDRVLMELSNYVDKFKHEGNITIKQLIDGNWVDANNWRNLAH